MALWASITFGRAVDRSAATEGIVRQLRGHGLSVAGFAQHKNRDGAHESVDLVRLAVPGRVRLGVPHGRAPSAQAGDGCSFLFRPEAFTQGLEWLKQDGPAADVLLIDEVGKLEVAGAGHAESLRWALALAEPRVVVITCRAERLFEVVERFSPPGEPASWLEVLEPEVETTGFASRLAQVAAGRSGSTSA